VAAVVAIPTVAHMFAIFNNAEDAGRTVIIDWACAVNAVSTAVACQATLLGLVGQLREATPADALMPIKKANGKGAALSDTSVRTILAGNLPATTGLATNWRPLGPSITKAGAATTPGYCVYADLDGKIQVPPGRYFALHVLANVVGETFIPFVGWHEKQIFLG
jgi:hypothetical protein